MKLRFKHSGASGDIIYSLPFIQHVCNELGAEAVLFIKLNTPNVGHPSFKHAYGDVMINEYAYKMLKPLLKEFDFIYDVLTYDNQAIDYDLDKFREIGMNLSAYDIKRWYSLAFPQFAGISTSKPLIHLEKEPQKYIVVNRTERYQNPNIDYRVLRETNLDIYFTGTEHEHALFSQLVPCEHKKVKDFLELAEFINNSSLFIGNQSMNFAIAETLKTDRALEICFHCPNVIPSGGLFYEIWDTKGLINAVTSI